MSEELRERITNSSVDHCADWAGETDAFSMLIRSWSGWGGGFCELLLCNTTMFYMSAKLRIGS